MKKLAIAAAALVASTQASLACGLAICPTSSVPEISALEGTAALAVVAALVMLVWERRRRAS